MKLRYVIPCLLVLLLSTGAWAESPLLKSTADDQTAIEITVYNSNIGLVKDTRIVPLRAGRGEMRFMDVAAHIMPVTVHVSSKGEPQPLRILEQNYEYDLMNGRKLLDKYVGKQIKIVDRHRYQDRKDVIEATLLSNNEDQIYKIGGEIYIGHPGIKVLPEIPENLIAQPTLTWFFESRSDTPQQIEVSYLTGNIGWKADYVMVLDKNDVSSALAGWVTIDNKSGATYREAKLKLIAGEVNRVKAPQADMTVRRELLAAKAAPQFEEQSFFEYHIYDLLRRTTIKHNQTKQISLLEAAPVGVTKTYNVYGTSGYFTRAYAGKKQRQPVEVHISFMNSADNNLGMPLPAGVIRLYKKDAAESQQFIGEDSIVHTPKDEKVILKVGKAFDIVVERTQTDFKQITSRLFESEWKIILKNHKAEDITVNIVEPIYGNWEITDNSHPYRKVDAFTVRFNVPVAKDGEVTVSYRARLGI